MGEGQTLYDVGKFYFEHHHYEISLACLLCARNVLDKIQSPLGNEAQNQIEKMHQALGHEKFTALLVKIESQAQKVVDQALHNELQFSD